MKQIFVILFVFSTFSLWAQSPKREMRATWLATVYRLDWPSSTITLTGNEVQINMQKKQMIGILDSLVSANMNAVCFQVRSRSDAMYYSSYEPWSADLVSTRGMDPGYDPLAFVVEEGHKRGLEVHAWVNPYRYESSVSDTPWNGQNDYRTTHPEWILQVGNASILDPGLPEVKTRITDIIREIVKSYDIDGVLFDDYFYLQGISSQDAGTFQKYNTKGLSLGDWRRSNVNEMIANVYKMIQEEKPYVTFGVSPAGVWDVSADIAKSYGLTLSNITSGYAYNGIYCDPVAWLSEGSIDYISPQIYWTIGSSNDYSVLSPWWSYAATHFGKQFYSSHSISGLSASLAKSIQPEVSIIAGINENTFFPREGLSTLEQAIWLENNAPKTRAFGASEVAAQIQVNRDADKNDAPGSVFYSTKKLCFTKNFINYLKSDKYMHKALVPAVNWKKTKNPGVVSNIALSENKLTWSAPVGKNVRYAIYALPKDKANDLSLFNMPDYYLGLSYTTSFNLSEGIDLSAAFAISVVDRYGNEYVPVIMGQEGQKVVTPELIYPSNDAEILSPFSFKWNAVSNAVSYVLELSKTSDFSSLICAREVTVNSFSTNNLMPLSQGVVYYWRVKAKGLGNESSSTPVRSFTCIPFSVLTPANNSEGLSLTPTFTWSNAGIGANYILEIAKSEKFQSTSVVYTQSYTTNTCQLPEKVLVGMTTYYVRVKTEIDGEEAITDVISFTTKEVIPEATVLITPTDGAQIAGSQVHVSWREEPKAKNFRVELCTDATFPSRQTKVKQINSFIYETDYTDIVADSYFLRVRGEYNIKSTAGVLIVQYTDWSPTVSFACLGGTGNGGIEADGENIYISSNGSSAQLVLRLQAFSLMKADLLSVSGSVLASVYNGEIPSGEYVLDIPLHQIPVGVYLIRININGQNRILKFIK